MRRPNTKCDFCKKQLYRQPSTLARTKRSFCSIKCKRKLIEKTSTCRNCNKVFVHPRYENKERPRKFCSHKCSNEARRGITYGAGHSNGTQRRLLILKNMFDFKCCMVKGCDYFRTLDIHRLLSGKFGGKYDIGNMFAICPNHHAEAHRNIVRLIRISDCELEAVYL